MQRREQQRRAVGSAGGSGGYLGGGSSGYSPVPRYDSPETTSALRVQTSSPAPSSVRAPAFKGAGMKLGTKKTKQAELLDALGGDVLASTASPEFSAPSTPAPVSTPLAQKNDGRGSLPEMESERCVVIGVSLWLLILICFQRPHRH